MAGSKLAELDTNNEYSQHDQDDLLTEFKLVNQAHQACREPPSTPACVGYANLLASSQFQRNNFYPRKRLFKKTLSAQENEPALLRHLNLYWGHADFRGPQLDICMSVMKGDDVLAVMPTGLGKSVCFQVPAVTLEFGVTIVLSPLVALMQDQVSGLKAKGIKAEMLFEKSTPDQLKYIKRQLGMGHPEIRLLYMTPETLFSNKIRADVQRAYEQKQLNRLVVDEAHVIQEWGTTFRSVYRELGQFREKFKDVPISAFTASAAEDTRAYIRDTLGMRHGHYAQWVEPFNRKNLFYEVRYQGAARQEDQVTNLADFIHRYRPEAYKRNMANGVQAKTVSGLVYCRRRATCEEIADELVKRGIKARAFHAKLSDERRNALLTMWKDGLVECIVATIAFGMGVDQAHVRYVVHYDMPKTFEGYYQETGRAGRDGHISRCILFYSREDARYLRSQAGDVSSDPTARTKMSEEESLLAKNRMLNSFKAVQHFAEDDRTCRHVSICRYFGEVIDASNQEVLEAYCNKMCDVCSNPGAVKRRAFALTEDIDVCSQAIRPVTWTLTANDAARLDAVQEASQEDVNASAAPIGTLGSLRALYGTAAQTSSNTTEDELPLRRYGGFQKASKLAALPRSAGVRAPLDPPPVADAPGASLTDLHGSALFQEDITEDKEDWMDWPDSAKSRPGSPVGHTIRLEETSSRVADMMVLGSPGSPSHSSSGRQAAGGPAEQLGPRLMIPVACGLPDPSTQAGPSRPAASLVPQRQASIRTSHILERTAMLPGDPSHAFETPCPRPGSRSGIKSVRTGHPSLLNSSRPNRPAMTVDMHDFGQYAVAETGETDPDKSKRQKDAFRAVTPITGRGPYSYYTNTAPPMTGRKRKLSTAQQQGSSFRTPFKEPYLPDRVHAETGTISVDDRRAALRQIKEALKKSLVDGPEADRLWTCWHREGSRKSAIRDAAVDLEALIVNQSQTPAMLRKLTEDFVQAVRILRVTEGADIIVEHMLDEFEGDELARWLQVLDDVMRGLGGRGG